MVESSGLLNRRTVKSCTEGSNPSLSAILLGMTTKMLHVRVDENIKQRAAKVPNATTVKAMRAADKGKGERLKSAGALFKNLGI